MAREVLNNGETGLSFRNKLNNNFTELYQFSDQFVHVLAYGAVAYTSEAAAATGDDSSGAFQAALDAAALTNRVVYVPPGRYRLNAPLSVTAINCGIVGAGRQSTRLVVTHTAGEAIRFLQDSPVLRDVLITSGGARAALSYDETQPGVRIELADLPFAESGRGRTIDFRNVGVFSQPGSGIQMVGPVTGQIDNCTIRSNKGHGIYMAQQILPRTNTNPDVPGLCEIVTCQIVANGGHAILSGGPDETFSSPSVRVHILNNEIGSNALDAAVRRWPSEIYYRGANMTMELNVLKPGNLAHGIEGWFVAGVNLYIQNNRYIRCTRAGTISSFAALPTVGVIVDGVQMIGAPNPIDPVVMVRVESGAEPRQIDVRNVTGGVISTIIETDATMGSLGASRVPSLSAGRTVCVYPTSDFTINNTTSPTDVPGFAVRVPANARVYFQAIVEYSGDATADIGLRMIGPSGSTVRFGTAASLKLGTSDTATGQGSLAQVDSMIFGAAGANRRMATLYGYCQNGSTAGPLRLQVRQASAVVADTTVHAGLSHLNATWDAVQG